MLIRTMRKFKSRFLKYISNIVSPIEYKDKLWSIKIYLLRKAGIIIKGQNTIISRGFDFIEGNEHFIEINDYCSIGHNCNIWAFHKVQINTFTTLAANVTITNGSHNKNSFEPYSGELIIGKGVWIGVNALISGSITIGDNSIIGAQSNVIKDVPKNAIVAGNPAKVIGYRELPSKVWHFGNIYYDPISFKLVDEK